MTPTDDETRRQLEAAKLRAAETANALKSAPRATYPGQGTPMQDAAPRRDQNAMQDFGAMAQSVGQTVAPAQAPAQPAPAAPAQPQARSEYKHVQGQRGQSATPGIDAVLAVNRRAADRATADAGRNVEDMAAQRKRRERLRGELMQASLKLANPNASPLELDMARRRR